MTINDNACAFERMTTHSHHFTSPRLWHLLEPRPSVADSGGALPAHRQRHVVRVLGTFRVFQRRNATDVRKRRFFSVDFVSKKWAAARWEVNFPLAEASEAFWRSGFFFFSFRIFCGLSNFLCRFSGGLDNGKSLSYLRGHGWQPASSEKYPSFCNENLYENHTFESQNSNISSKYFQLFKCQI